MIFCLQGFPHIFFTSFSVCIAGAFSPMRHGIFMVFGDGPHESTIFLEMCSSMFPYFQRCILVGYRCLLLESFFRDIYGDTMMF